MIHILPHNHPNNGKGRYHHHTCTHCQLLYHCPNTTRIQGIRIRQDPQSCQLTRTCIPCTSIIKTENKEIKGVKNN